MKSNTVLLTVRHCCNISQEEAVLPGCNDPKMGRANSLHALALYREYNQRFDSINYATKNKQMFVFVINTVLFFVQEEWKNKKM